MKRNNSTFKRKIKNTIFVFLAPILILTSCESGPSACECVEKYEYFRQDGGLLKLDQDKLNKCTEKFKDPNANIYPEDTNSGERNARKECK